MRNYQDKVIVALDVKRKQEFEQLLESFANGASWVKIGMECFYALGPESVSIAKKRGLKVFLDLKLHDIPNTVEQSVYALCGLGVDMINVHALGGKKMMEAAANAVRRAQEELSFQTSPKLLAVTHLTSLDGEDLKSVGIQSGPEESVVNLAKLAQKAKLDGVVCSAREAALVKEACGEDFLTVTPGIRTASTAAHDQKRVTTPQEAVLAGSDYLVIGRSITQASDPAAALNKIFEELK